MVNGGFTFNVYFSDVGTTSETTVDPTSAMWPPLKVARVHHQLCYLAENSKCKKYFCDCGTDVAQFFHREMRKNPTSAEITPDVGYDVGYDVGSAVVVGDH